MQKRRYISVILPLKLEWLPCYWTDEDIEVGDRVTVSFAGKEYTGVVARTDAVPDIAEEKIRKVGRVERDMERILGTEIELWQKVADYYLCSVGEVYKAAYPSGKINLEQARAEARRKVCLNRKKTLDAIVLKLEKLNERLEKKTLQAEKAKDGTKIKAKCLEDIEKIKTEITIGEVAKEAAARSLKAAENGIAACYDSVSIPVNLSSAQQKAFDGVMNGFLSAKPVLQHGVTGAGKTEIYKKLAIEVLEQNRNVVYLVPEIA